MERLRSLDIFRGLTVALMILVNNPGSWSHIYPPFEHASWHGLTPTDLVFPFFLFAVGNALAIVMPRLTLQKILKRTFLVFAIGLALNWFPFFLWVNDALIFKGWTWIDAHGNLAGLRVLNVLQRIALAYGFAATLAYFFPKKVLSISAFLLVGYWALAHFCGTPGDPYSLEGFFGTAVDRALLGPIHLYQGEGVAFDPEGLMSTISSIAQVLLGFWVGKKFLETGAQAFAKKALPALVSFWVIGLALLMVLVRFIDVKKSQNSILPVFEAFGKNPLFIYVLSGFVPKLMSLIRVEPNGEGGWLNPLGWFYVHVCSLLPGPPENGSLLYAFFLVLFYSIIAVWMDRKKVYIRV
jgi:predicted acyltransferase